MLVISRITGPIDVFEPEKVSWGLMEHKKRNTSDKNCQFMK